MLKKLFVLLWLWSPLFYIAFWNCAIANPWLFSAVSSVVRTTSSTSAKISVGTSVNVVVWRYGVLPVYCSQLGDLTFIHEAYIAVYIAVLVWYAVAEGKKLLKQEK